MWPELFNYAANAQLPHFCPACFPGVRSKGCDVLLYVPQYPPLGGMLRPATPTPTRKDPPP